MAIRKTGSKPPKFTGALARQIKVPSEPPSLFRAAWESPEGTALEEAFEAANAKWRKERFSVGLPQYLERIELLLKHYGIERVDNNGFLALALRLAHDFVPGFRFDDSENRGRPTTWDEWKLLRLYRDVQVEIRALAGQKRTSTESAACRLLLGRDPWKSMRSGNAKLTAKTLRNRYDEAKTSSDLVALVLRMKAGGVSVPPDEVPEVFRGLLDP